MHLESCNLSSLTMLMENHGRSTRNPPEVNIAFENRGRSTRIYPSNPFKSEQRSIKLLEFKSIQNTTRSMPSFPNPNINPFKSTISPVDSHASILTVLGRFSLGATPPASWSWVVPNKGRARPVVLCIPPSCAAGAWCLEACP